jgi:hypothetical protein
MPLTMGLLFKVATPEMKPWGVPIKFRDIASQMTR